MASVFISHSSAETRFANEVADSLRAAGYSVFLDEDGLRGGERWQEALYSHLRRCEAVVAILTPTFLASRWCFVELALARALGRVTIPLLRAGDPASTNEVIADVQFIDVRGEAAPGLERLVASLESHGIAPRGGGWDPQTSPYPGLRAFSRKHVPVFFGRDGEITRLAGLLNPTLERGAARFVVVIGASGSGKSSLVRAGLIPGLERARDRWLVLEPMMPGSQPVGALARTLARGFRDAGLGRELSEVEAALAGDEARLAPLGHELLVGAQGAPDSVLLFVDQFEEVVTRAEPDQRVRFERLLRGTIQDGDSPFWILATVRSDFLTPVLLESGLADLVRETMVLSPIDRNVLAEVIAGPAKLVGLEFDPALVERLVADATGGDALPLLAYTLERLWEAPRPGATLTLAQYDAIGGVRGSIRSRADETMRGLEKSRSSDHVLDALLELVVLDKPDAEPAGRTVREDELRPDQRAVLDAFVDARLVAKGEEGGAVTYQVAHEALLRNWQPLRHRVEDQRGFLTWRRRLADDIAEWDLYGHDREHLLRGVALKEAERWYAERPDRLSPRERDFVEASLRARRRQRARIASAWGVFLAVVAAGGGFALFQRGQIRERNEIVLSQLLAGRAASVLDSTGEGLMRSGLLALHSIDRSWNLPAYGQLMRVLALLPPYEEPVIGADATAAAFSPDGATLAFGARGRVFLADARAEAVLDSLEHGQPVRRLRFSPDGRWLAAAGERSARVWDRSNPGAAPHEFQTRETIRNLSFSDDGTRFTIGTEGFQWVVYETATARVVQSVETRERVISAALSPDGRMLATGGLSREVWDVANGHSLAQFGTDDVIHAVAFLSASPDEEIAQALPGSPTPFQLQLPRALDLLLSPVIAVGGDRGIDLFQTGVTMGSPLEGEQVRVLPRWGRLPVPARTIELAAGGRVMATARGVTVHVWRLVSTPGPIAGDEGVWSEVARLPHADAPPLGSVAFDSAPARLATAFGRLRVWHPGHGAELMKFDCRAPTRAAAFLSDGGRLAAACGSEIVVINATTGEAIDRVDLGSDVRAVAVSHDGRWIAALHGERNAGRLTVLGSESLDAVLETDTDAGEASVAFLPRDQWLLLHGARRVRAIETGRWVAGDVFDLAGAGTPQTDPAGSRLLDTRPPGRSA